VVERLEEEVDSVRDDQVAGIVGFIRVRHCVVRDVIAAGLGDDVLRCLGGAKRKMWIGMLQVFAYYFFHPKILVVLKHRLGLFSGITVPYEGYRVSYIRYEPRILGPECSRLVIMFKIG
jgi:hypothetical protein